MIVEKLLAALIVVLPLQFALNAGSNVDLVFTRVLAPLIFFLWLARGLAAKQIRVANSAITWLLLLFLFFSALSLFWSENAYLGTRKLLYLFTLAPLYFVAADVLHKVNWRKNILRSISASGFLAAAIALFQFMLQFMLGIDKTIALWGTIARFFLGASFSEIVVANSSWLVNVSGKTLMRAFGFFPDPHAFSFFVSICLFCSLGLALEEKRAKWKYFALVGAALMFLAATLSFSRGAYIGIIMAGIFFLAVYFERSGNLKKFLAVCLMISALAAVFFWGSIGNRFASALNPKEGSNLERILNWKQAVNIVGANPLFGVGLGNYSHKIDPLAPERSSIYAHNIYLDASAETGIINGIIILLLLGASFYKNLLSKNMAGLGIASAILYFAVHGVFDTPLYSPQVFVLLMLLFSFGAAEEAKRTRAS